MHLHARAVIGLAACLALACGPTGAAEGFGIAVYGVGSYTSYMNPGGLDVKQINVPG